MAQVGKIDDFRPEVEPWTAYIERLEQYLEANDVDKEKHVAVLLSVMGAKAYGLLRNLVQPEKPKDKTFGEIVDILKEHYEPKTILVAERFRFNRCNQKTSQTVAQYVAELKHQAANCDFGASLDSALRDRFVSGIKNEACQRRLLSEDRLTFAKAFEIALNMETADRDTRQLRGAEGEWTSEANIHKIKYVGEPKHLSLNELLDTYSDVFKEELGTLKDIKATIVVKPEMLPKFNKHRPLPFAMKEKVEKELERLEKCNIITPVRHSEWAAPIVPVLKSDASIRLCGDYKLSVNQGLEADTYPLPRLEELLATLRGGKYFSKIDLAAAYQQVLLNEDSKKYTTINTHKGLFVYNRLPFGISTAPLIFQRIMENIMKGLPVVVYLDDLLITGCSKAEHLSNLEKVLQRLQENGLRVKRSKCEFNKPQIEYLGHVLDEHGVHPSEEKVRAIQDAPASTNVKELQAFLGLVNYYGRFVPMQSTALAPLYKLLKDSVTWRWTDPEQAAFDRCKGLLTSDRVLAHYDSNLPLTLACDASAYGIGAVTQHTMPSGEERPIAYASRTLSPAEKKYSQIEKEALGLIYGVKKFHQYLWGRHFTLATDHRPLLTLFGEHKNLPTLAAARIQRWAIILSAYDYHIVFKKSAEHSNADGLSRCPLPETSDTGTALSSAAVHSLLIAHMEEAPLNATQVAQATRRDMDLSKVYQYVMEGWPTVTDESLKAYHNKRNELSTERGCVLWGTRVIIPSKMRMAVLNEIHSGHQGIVKSKALARKYVWWPNLDYDLEQVCKTCETCQLEQKMPQHVPLHPWEFPGESWKRLHIDFAGPFLESMFMIVVDSYSKWLEVFRMPHITSQATITRLKRLFASYGLPEQIVTDNATTFTSAEFQTFVTQNGILHTSAPGHPSTNGLAERYVQTFKVGMKKLASVSGSIEDKLSLFLLQYRVTPNCTTGQSPAELFLHRHIRTRLDFIKPNIKETVRRKQYRQKAQHDFTAVDRSFSVDDAVYLRNTGGGVHKWTPGQVVRQTGPVSYEVKERYSNTVHRRHGDQLRAQAVVEPDIKDIETPTQEQNDVNITPEQSALDSGVHPPVSPDPSVVVRRSTRPRKTPKRYLE
ncbi:uncharacterized protein K02A2.6-like [Xiphophorus maculatus]|uniref:uncharacterized protein K02A2.6-like n=1 Tax=Xiphophorus maculatus TaxID=8083 RepID=UPI000C6CCCC5|nr:uncharacterized protein K02A2.6-like [Xiphophorus maculatus]